MAASHQDRANHARLNYDGTRTRSAHRRRCHLRRSHTPAMSPTDCSDVPVSASVRRERQRRNPSLPDSLGCRRRRKAIAYHRVDRSPSAAPTVVRASASSAGKPSTRASCRDRRLVTGGAAAGAGDRSLSPRQSRGCVAAINSVSRQWRRSARCDHGRITHRSRLRSVVRTARFGVHPP